MPFIRCATSVLRNFAATDKKGVDTMPAKTDTGHMAKNKNLNNPNWRRAAETFRNKRDGSNKIIAVISYDGDKGQVKGHDKDGKMVTLSTDAYESRGSTFTNIPDPGGLNWRDSHTI